MAEFRADTWQSRRMPARQKPRREQRGCSTRFRRWGGDLEIRPDQKDNYFCYISLSASLHRFCEQPRGRADSRVSKHARCKEHVSKASAINSNLSSDLPAVCSGAGEANPVRPGDLVPKIWKVLAANVSLDTSEVSRSVSAGAQNPPRNEAAVFGQSLALQFGYQHHQDSTCLVQLLCLNLGKATHPI